jgi:hypothetical protein
LPMKTALIVLAQPVYLAIDVLRQLQTKPSAASVGLAIMIAIIVLAGLKYVLGGLCSGGRGLEGFLARVSGLFSRLLIGLVIYAVMSVLIYGFINLGSALLHEMDNSPQRQSHTPR